MDFVDRLAGHTRLNLRPETLFKLTDLSRPVQKHLEKVYVTLAGALLVSAIGCYVSAVTGLASWLFLSVIGFVGCSMGLMMTPHTPSNLNKRYGFLAGAAFMQGATMAPLVMASLHQSPALIVTAFLATAAVFGCFSGAAMMSRRRSWLYLGGYLSSAISTFMVMRLATWVFGGRSMMYSAELYLGLLVFMGYVLFDTQMIIEKAYAGETDHIKHALDLFVDFVAIFVRILVILLNKQEKQEKRSRQRRRY